VTTLQGRHLGRRGPTNSPQTEQCGAAVHTALRTGPGVQRPEAPTTNQKVLCCSGCSVTEQRSRQSKVRSTSWLVSIDSHGCAHNHREGLWFLTLVFNDSFVSYCSDSSLCIIVTTTYSDIELPSRSASSTSRLRNAPYLLASCHTFCLNPRQSSRGLCRVQVVINLS